MGKKKKKKKRFFLIFFFFFSFFGFLKPSREFSMVLRRIPLTKKKPFFAFFGLKKRVFFGFFLKPEKRKKEARNQRFFLTG
jgi:hypothetical protein